MDQNADGTPDQNPLTLADGFTGMTPGDVYAVPTPQPTAAVTFTEPPQSILSPPFNQNTLPLIVPGPQIVSTTVVGTSGQLTSGARTNLLTNDTTSEFQVTFDRPIQTEPFTPGQVAVDHGPDGLDHRPADLRLHRGGPVDPRRDPAGPGTLNSTVTINSGGTLQIQDLTVSLSIASTADSGLTAVLIAPNGTQIPLFSGLGGSEFRQHRLRRLGGERPSPRGRPRSRGRYKPEYTSARPRSPA